MGLQVGLSLDNHGMVGGPERDNLQFATLFHGPLWELAIGFLIPFRETFIFNASQSDHSIKSYHHLKSFRRIRYNLQLATYTISRSFL